jgi:hypothetical protein
METIPKRLNLSYETKASLVWSFDHELAQSLWTYKKLTLNYDVMLNYLNANVMSKLYQSHQRYITTASNATTLVNNPHVVLWALMTYYVSYSSSVTITIYSMLMLSNTSNTSKYCQSKLLINSKLCNLKCWQPQRKLWFLNCHNYWSIECKCHANCSLIIHQLSSLSDNSSLYTHRDFYHKRLISAANHTHIFQCYFYLPMRKQLNWEFHFIFSEEHTLINWKEACRRTVSSMAQSPKVLLWNRLREK